MNLVPHLQERWYLKAWIVAAAVAMSVHPIQGMAATVHVAPGGNDSNDGSSWATAKRTVQAGLQAATAGDQVRVSAGTYVEHIRLKAGVELYGGFVGRETLLIERDWMAHPTILDGNQTGTVVISPSGATTSTRIDGFTIQNGKNVVSGTFQGGGVYCSSSSPTVANCTIRNNSSEFGGGMSNTMGSAPVLSSCTFVANYATITGGGMHNEASNPVLTGCSFTANTASGMGGGMTNVYSATSLTDCTFSSNSSDMGGGMYNHSCSPMLVRCTFSQNSADEAGGMSNYVLASPILTNCTFIGNQTSGAGGAMHNYADSSPTLTHCTIANNSGGGAGGIINRDNCSPTLTYCTIRDNTSGWTGGGIANYSLSNPTLTNCTISGNAAVYGGGVCNMDGSSPTMTHCILSKNSASDSGGGMLTDLHCQPIITACAFNSNTATNQGGGVHNQSSSTLADCLFSRNSSPLGGAISTSSVDGVLGVLSLVNCTLAGNSADTNGGGLYIGANMTASLANCIAWANTAQAGPQIHGTAMVSYSCVQEGWTGTGNIMTDPLLVDPANDDLRLSAGSPCIDAGDNTAVPASVATDAAGNPRFVDDPATPDTGSGTAPLVDMGAHEYQPTPADFTNDGHVDAADLEVFQQCVTGPALPYMPGSTGCSLTPDATGHIAADLDADGDVDQTDFGILQRCYTGDSPADPGCIR
jgi:predicted outer membrane repeat protein